jgi:hypothetical protein
MLLIPLGALITALNHDPLSALLNAASLSGYVGKVTGWIRRRPDRLQGISARQLLDVLQEVDGNVASLLGPPDAVADLAVASLQLPDGTIARGRVIDYVREEPDGSRSWIRIE